MKQFIKHNVRLMKSKSIYLNALFFLKKKEELIKRFNLSLKLKEALHSQSSLLIVGNQHQHKVKDISDDKDTINLSI